MPRKQSVADALITLPWWLNLVFAAVAYFSLKYWIPGIESQNIVFQGLIKAAPHFALIIAGLLILMAALSALHAWRKGELLNKQTSIQSIQNLSWKDFEYLVSEAYSRKGFTVHENLGSGADGGIDLTLSKDGKRTLVQCKNWKSQTVGVSTIRELFGIVTAEGADEGIVVCSGHYTADAQDFAKGKPLTLIDGNHLTRLISKVQTAQKVTEQPEITCPSCGSSMVVRLAKKGKNTGDRFLGCSRFPKCRGTRQYDA